MSMTTPFGSATKNRRTPHGSSVSGYTIDLGSRVSDGNIGDVQSGAGRSSRDFALGQRVLEFGHAGVGGFGAAQAQITERCEPLLELG